MRFQSALPHLPIPALLDTCELYLELVRPLLGDRELASTQHAVAEFARPGGAGEVLQERLLHWSTGRDHWLEPFWDDWYLGDDTPLPVHVSPGFVLSGADRPQVARAARLLAAALEFKAQVDREQLAPDTESGSPRCMAEYPRVLSSTRIPGAERDVLERHPGSRHVVVAHGSRIYSLDVLDESGAARSVGDLQRALERVVADPPSAGPSLGALTTGPRRSWAATRAALVRKGSLRAREALEAIETAILLLVLESTPPPGRPRSVEAARMALHGDGRSRWFDKSIQLVVATDGTAGFCMEHSGFDGSTALRFAEFLATAERIAPSGATAGHGAPPRLLELELSRPFLAALEHCDRDLEALIRRTDLAMLDFEGCGRQAIVSYGLSPDGFVQMAFQLAAFTLTGAIRSTYESVDTKRFLHGRTEAMRSVSNESVDLVHAVRGARDRAASAQLLRAAVRRHSSIVKRCKEGRGVDRHLLGLRRMLGRDEELPSLFVDPAYATLTRSVLSTSALRDTPGVELICFGPVVPEGLGLSYSIGEDSIRVVASSFQGQATSFVDELERSLLELRQLLERA